MLSIKKKRIQIFFKRFHHTYCCDELIFQTLFHGHEDELNIDGNNALRYINWNKMVLGRRHIGSPLILNEEEYNEKWCFFLQEGKSGNFKKTHRKTAPKRN